MTFEQLNLASGLVQTLHQKGYLHPTPIQQKAIPPILAGSDVFGCAQTGTGKTAAFALPILQMMHRTKGKSLRPIQTLVLAPTRELASQIRESFEVYGNNTGLYATVVYGGVSQVNQIKALRRGVDVLVATPGRLLDLMNQGFIKMKDLRFLVLDEADRMLDMGFIHDIRKIMAALPRDRQTMCFSATVTRAVQDLSKQFLKEPVLISVQADKPTPDLVDQRVYYVPRDQKRALLKHILSDEAVEGALVFTRTKYGAEKLGKELNRVGISTDSIHGDKSQNARDKAVKGFKNKGIRVLVATDVASRGLDIDSLSHVINFEIPEQTDTYIHRIGRTGRAGKGGIAISLCSSEERASMQRISRAMNSRIQSEKLPAL